MVHAHIVLGAVLVDSLQGLERFRAGWDELAVACGRPYCAPAWQLAWWRRVAPAGARLRVALALDDDATVAGIAPLFVERARSGYAQYRLLGSRTSSQIGPLARPGLEEPVAAALSRALASARPRPRALRLERMYGEPAWGRLLARAWPGVLPPRQHFDVARPQPYVTIAGRSYDAWFADRSSNFRQQMRRVARKIQAREGVTTMTRDAEALERDVASFVRLHLARWAPRGGSAQVDAPVEMMLREAGADLLDDARFRLWSLDIDGERVSSHLFIAAGGEVIYFNGGFDERYAELKPSMHVLLAALEDCFGRGDRGMDLGFGAQPYKLRLADDDRPSASMSLYPRDVRYPCTRLQTLPGDLATSAWKAGRLLPPRVQAPIKRELQRRGW